MAGADFRRHHRLLTPEDFRRVFQQACKSTDAAFTVFAAPREAPGPRLGIAVSKQRVRSAVQRNRIKRIIRESFRNHLSQLPGLDVIVMARQGADARPNAELFRALEKHWNKIARKCRAS